MEYLIVDSNSAIFENVILEEEVTTDPVSEVIIDSSSGQEEDGAEGNHDGIDGDVVILSNVVEKSEIQGLGDQHEEDEEEEVYEVESVQQERTRKGVKEYMVRWKGYGPEYDTWEPEDNLNCDDIIEQFHRQKRKRGRKATAKNVEDGDDHEDEEQPLNPPKKKRAKRDVPKKQPPKKKSSGTQKATTGTQGGGTKKRSKKEPPLVIRCKTIFKKRIIKNCIQCEDRRHPDDDLSTDAIVKYFMRYDLPSGNFFVGDVKVDVDEIKKCIKCSKCDKVFGDLTLEQKVIPGKAPLSLWQMVRDMKLHIVGRHLGGFTCPLCDEPYVFHTRSATHYYRHTSQFHRDDHQTTGEIKSPVQEDEEVVSD